MPVNAVLDFRAAPSAATVLAELGPLGDLPGTWSGHGFNWPALADPLLPVFRFPSPRPFLP